MKLVLILFILTILLLPSVVNAVDSTTVGSVTLVSTFKSIGVYSNYTGDDNNNSIATLEYKEKSATDWKQGHSLYIDRGVWLRSEGRLTNRQGKGSIVMLQPNTEYDVKVTYSDLDGVSGTNPVIASIRTRDESSPTGTGNSYYVATTGSDTNPGTDALPFRTIQKAVSLLQAGGTVYIKAGTYTETITIYGASAPSGTANNYITVRNYGNDEVIIDGGCNLANNINLGGSRGYVHGGNYIRIAGLTLKNANASAISLDDIIGIWIENNQMIDFNCADLQGQQYGAVGAWDTTNLVIRNNIISRNVGASATTCTGTSPPASDAIWIKNNGFGRGGGHIIYSNKISGNVRDGVGGEPEGPSYGSLYKDTDIYNNEVTGCADDGVQADSGGINIRIWNNTIRNCLCSGFSLSPASEGPLYIFRNVISGLLVNGGISGYKEGSAGNGRAYLYHNSAYVWNSDVYGGGVRETNMVYKNNIMSAGRYAYESPTWPPYDFDYNVLYETDPGRFIYWMSISYSTLPAFRNATGQDLNSINADPLFIDQTNGDLRLQSASPAIDKGLVIPNFNDQDSAWPYKGSNPDIGAVEFDSGAPTFSFTLSANPSSGTVIQGSSTTTTVTSTLTSGSTQSVSLTSTISPNEPTITRTFSTSSGNPTYTSTLTIATTSSTPAVTYTITITAIGGSLVRTTSYSLTVSSTDATKPRWSNNQTNSTLAGVFVNHSVVLSDDSGLDYYIFEFDNGTNSLQNISAVDISGLQVTVNRVVLINSTVGSIIRWRYYFNDTSNNWNATDLFSYRTADTIPPVRSNGQPTGTLPAGTTQTNISVITNEAATCRYSTISGIAYVSMTNAFSTTGSTFHSRLITGLINGSSYRYYARCNDTAGNANFDDYNISFSVGLSGENCIDADLDNYYSTVNCIGGNDCNDANAAINPSAAEVCGNGIDENCDGADATCPTQPPSPPPLGGGGGGVVTIGNPVETPITKEPEVKEAVKVEENIGAISLELISPDSVESGEMFNATVWLLSPVTSAYSLTVDDMQQEISLEAGKEMLVTIPVRAPEARGVFTLTAAIDGTSRAKNITLDYLPLFLYVNETRVGNETLINVTVKNYESMSTELRVIKDGRSDAFFELIEGKKEYNRQLKLTQAGEYKIIATASSGGQMVDTDEYLLTVGGERGFDYRLIVIIVFAFVVMVITLIVMIR